MESTTPAELWRGSLSWAAWQTMLLFFSFIFCPPIWIMFTIPLGHKFNKVPIIKFMSYLTSHIYLMMFLMLVGITPVYPVVRASLNPYWYEWVLLVWLSGLLLFELTNPSDKSGLGWIKLAVLLFGMFGVAMHVLSFAAINRMYWPTSLYLRNQLFAISFLFACVQILDFLSFHHLFGPWAIIIGDLMKDLARFLAVLAIFVFGFSMNIVALNQPFKNLSAKEVKKMKPYDGIPFAEGNLTEFSNLTNELDSFTSELDILTSEVDRFPGKVDIRPEDIATSSPVYVDIDVDSEWLINNSVPIRPIPYMKAAYNTVNRVRPAIPPHTVVVPVENETNDKDEDFSATLINGSPVRISPLESFELLFFAVFGMTTPTTLQKENRQPEWTKYLFKAVFMIYMLVSVVVLINLLIAMMSDTYQRIQAQSDIEWKYGLAKLIRNMHRTTTTPSPLNLITSWLVFLVKMCGKKMTKRKRPSLVQIMGIQQSRVSPRTKMGAKWLQKVKKGQVAPKDSVSLGVVHLSPLGSQMSFNNLQRIENVADWEVIGKKYRALMGEIDERSHDTGSPTEDTGSDSENNNNNT
uniref:Ion transport domain-containing protein n=1 Tax=Timema poppense TaxID=170557 RepID=A0A7R9H9P9_TIMPO|nr:unnamed protein product [Timema poppensis]